MEKEKVIVCIDCKRKLSATNENFSEIKKGKYGLNNVCRDCQEHRKSCGIGSKWRKRAMGKYIKPIVEKMTWKFNDFDDMKEFAKFISSELIKNGKEELALEVNEFSYNTFTTSSEYLGEFRIVLNKILGQKDMKLNKEVIQSILSAIDAIDKAFKI